MDQKIDGNNSRNNMMYYNQLLRNERNKKKVQPKKRVSFASQKIDLSKFSFTPAGYEGVAYTIYFIIIPYFIGAVFLLFYVAHGNFDNFKLLDKSAILIVWAIGYEIVAAIMLLYLFFSFITYDTKNN